MPRATRDNLGYLLAKASARWNELLYERFVEAGFAEVRPAYGSVLLPLFEEDGLRMGELARRARLAKQTMTTLVRLAERDGLVIRGTDPSDGRATLVRLTPRAREFRSVAERALADLEALVEHALGPRVTAELHRSLKGVMDLCERAASQPRSIPRRRRSSPTSRTSRTSPAGRPSSRAS